MNKKNISSLKIPHNMKSMQDKVILTINYWMKKVRVTKREKNYGDIAR